MSEEQRPTEENTQSQPEVISRADSALNALDGLDGFSADNVRNEIQSARAENETQDSQQTVEETNQGGEAQETTEEQQLETTVQSESQQQEEQNTETQEEATEGLTISSNIFGEETFSQANKDGESEGTQPEATPQEVSDFFKANEFGIDENNFNERVSELTAKEAEFDKATERIKSYEEVFTGLPIEVHEAIKSFYNGESNWDRHVKERISLDFRKDFDTLDAQDVVSKYFPGQVSKEDWEEFNDAEGDERVKGVVQNYINLSKSKFESDKTSYNQKVTDAKNSQQVAEQKYQASFDDSRGNLNEVFKDKMPNEVYLNTIDNEITKGGIMEMFYNPDGTLKKEAHQRYIMARDGFDTVNQFREALKREIASKERMSILERSSDTPRVDKTSSTTVSSEKELENRVKSAVDNIMPGMDENKF